MKLVTICKRSNFQVTTFQVYEQIWWPAAKSSISASQQESGKVCQSHKTIIILHSAEVGHQNFQQIGQCSSDKLQ